MENTHLVALNTHFQGQTQRVIQCPLFIQNLADLLHVLRMFGSTREKFEVRVRVKT